MAINKKFNSKEILSVQKVINDFFISYQYELYDKDWIIFRNLGTFKSIYVMKLPYHFELRIDYIDYGFTETYHSMRDLCSDLKLYLSTSKHTSIHNCNI